MVLYGRETWSLTLREEYRFGVFKNMVVGRIFRSKRNEVEGVYRKVNNEAIHNLHFLPTIRPMRDR
jgi:hypothetical protein